MNLIQLRSIVETLLGYYEYEKQSNGSWKKKALSTAPGYYYQLKKKVGPAIYVQGSSRVPSNWDAVGLETIIIEVPLPRMKRFVGFVQRTQVWTLYLQQWDSKKNVMDSVLLLSRHFGGELKTTYYRKGETDLSDRAMIQIQTEDMDLENWPTHGIAQAIPSPVENSPLSVFR